MTARLRHFLSYVVEEALAGRESRIKAYTIAVEVFGRSANFDVMSDPVVRIEAGRLRRALERYYLLGGSDAPIVISIPKGGYAPLFCRGADSQRSITLAPEPKQPSVRIPRLLINKLQRHWLATSGTTLAFFLSVAYLVAAGTRGPREAPQSPPAISIVVKRFATLSPAAETQVFVDGLSEEIVSQLASMSNLTVFQSEKLEAIPPPLLAKTPNNFRSSYILEGAIRGLDGKVRITARLLNRGTAAIVWSEAYEAELKGGNTFDLEASVASRIVASAVSSAVARSQASARIAAREGLSGLEPGGGSHR